MPRITRFRRSAVALFAIVGLSRSVPLVADDATPAAKPAATAVAAAEPVPLNPQKTVLLDREGKRLILKTTVVLRAGLLEMLLCKQHSKEHESILAIDSDAYVIHAGLLALGAEPGTPVQYTPEFKAPTGQKIEVRLRWKDEQGAEQTAPAQQWVRSVTARYYSAPLAKLPDGFTLPKETELRFDALNQELVWFGPMTAEQREKLLAMSTDSAYQAGIRQFFDESQAKLMEADWIFAGSAFWQEEDGEKYYQAEAGNVICVANFGDALLDVSVPSSASNDGLLFEPSTEQIPPLGTVVEIDLIPVPADTPAGEATDKLPPQQ